MGARYEWSGWGKQREYISEIGQVRMNFKNGKVISGLENFGDALEISETLKTEDIIFKDEEELAFQNEYVHFNDHSNSGSNSKSSVKASDSVTRYLSK